MAKASRKAKTAPPPPVPAQAAPPAKRGRPPGEPRTTIARWLRAHEMTVPAFAARLAELAATHGISEYAPQPKTLLDSINARSKPSLPVVMLIELATGGDVKVQHWVRDLY